MIEVKHLTKKYGDYLAVDDLSFSIDEGHVYGFLGPNGAGKSTTMNIITGCLSATEGEISIDGHDIFEDPIEAKKCIGYLPEMPPLYLDMTTAEYLYFVGQAKGISKKDLVNQIENVISTVGLENVANRIIKNLSKGYKQRVGLAQALLGSPKIIILDEPTVGLDPQQIIEIRELIKSLGEKHTVILSSHILSEVQAICEKVIIISHGKMVAFDTPKNLESKLQGTKEMEIATDGQQETVQSILMNIQGVDKFSIEKSPEGGCIAKINMDNLDEESLSRQIFFAFASSGCAIRSMQTARASLEDVFMELVASDEKNIESNNEELSATDGKEADAE